MASSRAPVRSLSRYGRMPPTFLCPRLQQDTAQSPTRYHVHTTTPWSIEYVPQQPAYPQEWPKWQETPPRMKAPFRSKPPVLNNDYPVNKDPVRLDHVYERVLGEGGEHMLTEEVKWLAVTHKSFDHGRRGYNDRLSFLGRRIVELQTSIALISESVVQPPPLDQTAHSPEAPFQDLALRGLENLTEITKRSFMEPQRIARLGEQYGLQDVIRWKPRKATDLQASGLPLVLQQALYAIVGAVALQKGGQVANEVVRERILNSLGLHA